MTTPRVRIVKLIRDLLADNNLAVLANLAAMGIAGPVNVRHTRKRYPNPEDGNCLSLRVLEDAPRDVNYLSINEMQNELAIDMIIDTVLPTDESELDPTGLETPGSIANAALKLLKSSVNSSDPDQASTLDGRKLSDLCDTVVNLGMVNDDDDLDGGSDDARFIQRISVLYRTDTEDPNILLAAGENL